MLKYSVVVLIFFTLLFLYGVSFIESRSDKIATKFCIYGMTKSLLKKKYLFEGHYPDSDDWAVLIVEYLPEIKCGTPIALAGSTLIFHGDSKIEYDYETAHSARLSLLVGRKTLESNQMGNLKGN
ncbi:hypothetical protein [Marinibactrum halimedae]|uniref:Uncharacterized protein n=1 Tax=Marinibactrum halimedae TaxID=1444977 RepID=A0AA37T900_9GAMM|nr:hypothetical protein [Marinibactrum halimedae]MCD9461234.1 hypothetical protein [Marinibactrum halimedae]GLS25645.1 hypothetical protein GCM10007877_13590 [Marinibactrum halimedae]